VRRVLIAVALLASLVAPTPGSAADAASPVPCSRFVSGAPDDAECFEVVVPTWHDGRDETTQVLSVLILRSRAARPEPDPVVYLAGGPGGSAIETVNLWFGSPIRATRDIILVEQRGTRFSRPFLACPEQTSAQLYVASVAISPEEHVDAISTATDDCRERLEADGVDLAAYTTAANADDLEVVRTALSVDRWNLYGISYGTRLGLEILRRHPEGVRSAVLDSAYPPDVAPYESLASNHARALDAFFATCRADAACVERYEDLESVFWPLVDQLNARPVPLFIPAAGGDVAGVFTGDMLVAQVTGSLSTSGAVRWVPAQIAALAAGNTAQYELSGDSLPNDTVGEGMRLSIECAERLAATDAADISADAAANPRLATFAARFTEPRICERWPVDPVDAGQLAPVSSDLPVLLVSGELDPLTPPAWADQAAATLSSATRLALPMAGHAASLGDPCVGGIVAAFIIDSEVQRDASCTREAIEFRTDIALSAGVPRAIVSGLSSVSPAPWPALFGIAGVVGAWLLAAAFGQLRRPGRRSGPWWTATATSLVVILTPVAVGLVVWNLVDRPEADILLLGLPSWAGWMLFLPWLVAALAVATIVAAAGGWLRRIGSRTERVAITAVALAGVAATLVLAAYGFVGFG
jgi:pimeloyl-ACP methyl ester carboxylesterase